jgi:hypothetical protein
LDLAILTCTERKRKEKMTDEEKELIGYCGYNCHLCDARSEETKVRQKLVDAWRKYLGHEHYTAENVFCVGCKNEGPHADKECKARVCAIEKGMGSCALCDDFPCDKMRHLMAIEKGMFIFGYKNFGQISEEDYNLCMRQWNSVPNLYKTLLEADKLPEWLKEREKKE